MKLVPLALAFVIGPFSLAAQSGFHAPVASPGNFNVVIGGNCLSTELEQRVGNLLETVQNDGSVYMTPGTQLMLTVPALPSPSPSVGHGVAGNTPSGGGALSGPPATRQTFLRVVSATATVYGFGGQPRVELVSPGSNLRGNIPARNLQLQFSAKDESSVAELWLPRFGAVHSLQFNSITWSDGSNWKPASGESCTVSPSGIMLVGADSSTGKIHP